MKSKKAQIWIETVIYTLIGLAIIGILLSIVMPAIEKKKDQMIIEQSLDMMNEIDNKVDEIKYGAVGNSRPVEILIKKGKLTIDGVNDKIIFSIESGYMYSEPGVPGEEISVGEIKVLTEEKTKDYDVSLILDYAGKLDITWNDEDVERIIQPAPSIQTIIVRNEGKKGELLNINFL